MASRRKISIVVPFYDEAESVDCFCEAILPVLARAPQIDFEVICVDDGSRDSTLEKLVRIAASDPRFCVIELSRNFGKEAALTAGIDAATGDAVVPIDADLQDPPDLILDMIRLWSQGAEVVLARRANRTSDSFLKRTSARIFYRWHNRLSEVQIPENVGDFRLMDRVAVDALKQLPECQRFMKGLFAWVGFKTVSLDYERNPRSAGTTKFSGWRLWNLALEGFTSFSTIPLKISLYLGGVGAVGTSIYAVFIISRALVHGIDTPGYASLIVAVLFLGSLQLLSVGVLGEYIGRTYMETKRRPQYLVRRRYGTKQ